MYGAIEHDASPRYQIYINPKFTIISSALLLTLTILGLLSVGIINVYEISFDQMRSNHLTEKDELVNQTVRGAQWVLSKNTVSVTSGKYMDVLVFVNKYITQTSDIINLGCNETVKVVGELVFPANDVSSQGFEQIHFVDSSVFQVDGLSIGNWSDAIYDLPYFNSFLHNKVQMFVPFVSPHLSDLRVNNIKIILRKSSSNGTSEPDTAHIGIYVPQAATMYEIVGPLSSLSDDEAVLFEDWSDYECPFAHTLPSTIDVYLSLYSGVLFSSSNLEWMNATGKNVPMGVAINVPTQSMDYISSTLDILSSLTNFDPVMTADGSCNIAQINMDSDSQFGPILRYVADNSTDAPGALTVGDWEDAVKQTHQMFINESAAFASWDRYLDTHIGLQVADKTNCGPNQATLMDLLATYSPSGGSSVSAEGGIQYTLRTLANSSSEGGAHYYIGTRGLKSIEVDLFGCTAYATDLCGCISTNNMEEYLTVSGVDSCV